MVEERNLVQTPCGKNGTITALFILMNNGEKVRAIMKNAKSIKSRRHFRLVKGKLESAIRGLSVDLQDSILREFSRQAPKTSALPY